MSVPLLIDYPGPAAFAGTSEEKFMKNLTLAFALFALVAASTAPARAADFSLFGSYWDTDVAGRAGGGGIALGLPFNDTFAVELRATYFEELNDNTLHNIFHSGDPVFQDKGIQALPLDAGVRIRFAPGSTFRPQIGGGLTYYFLDSDFGEISDEVGYYASVGATVGDDEGAQFFFEGLWRQTSAHVKIDPEHFDDIDDINVDDRADFDLDGFAANVGVRWTF